MKGRPRLEGHVQMSVLVPCDIYRELHLLRVARGPCGAKLLPIGGLIREALLRYVACERDAARSIVNDAR